MTPALVVWDFDGVLNANMTEGRFVWSDAMKGDLDLDPRAFEAHLFRSGTMGAIIRGQHDLLEVVADWLASQNSGVSAEALLAYWFERDARLDAQVLGWLQAFNGRSVIGTNNEARRADYIEQAMGLGAMVDRIFASGRLGLAKPDQGFFAEIERWAGLAGPQILLVDDSLRNVQAAQKRGWAGFHFTEKTRATLPALLGLGA